MSKTIVNTHTFGPTKVEIVTFVLVLAFVLGGLLGAYYYDLQQPFFTETAQQFYSWLIN